MRNQDKCLDSYEYLPGGCLRVKPNEHFWSEAEARCEDIKTELLSQPAQPDKLALLKDALTSKNISSLYPKKSWWAAADRIRGPWNWNGDGTLNLKDSNWMYDYGCDYKYGYICKAAPVKGPDQYEHLTGRTLMVGDYLGLWNEAEKHCVSMKSTQPSQYDSIDELTLLGNELKSKYIETLPMADNIWPAADRVKGTWKWYGDGHSNLTDSNWIYEYRCDLKVSYIWEAAPDTSMDHNCLFGSTDYSHSNGWNTYTSLIAIVGFVFLLIMILGLTVYIFYLKRRHNKVTVVNIAPNNTQAAPTYMEPRSFQPPRPSRPVSDPTYEEL